MDPQNPTQPQPQQSIQPTPESTPKLSFLHSKRMLLITAAALIFIAVVLVSLFFFLSQKKSSPQIKAPGKGTNETTVRSYPTFKLTYLPPTPPSKAPQTLPSYTLKTSFNKTDLTTFGGFFGFSEPIKVGTQTASFSDPTDPSTRAYLEFDTRTGAFDFSNIGTAVKIQGTDLKQGALSFLSSIGLGDSLTECEITYKNSLIPNVTYVECHKSWSKLGAPLLNLPGVLNIPVETDLSTLELGYNYAPYGAPDITDVSTGQDGVNRPNDFNTATFTIASDGTILALASNLRWVTSQAPTTLISPVAAFNLLSQNRAQTTIALPTAPGPFEWDDVFSKDTVTGENATINGFEVIYVENERSQSQTTYAPIYIFRGTVELDTGHEVNFVQTIPASQDLYTAAQIAEEEDSLQLRHFTLPTKTATFTQPTVTLTPTPKLPTRTPTPRRTPIPVDCKDPTTTNIFFSEFVKYQVKIDGALVTIASPVSAPNMFYLAQETTTKTDVDKFKPGFYRVLAEQFVWNLRHGKEPGTPEPAEGIYNEYKGGEAYGAVKGIYDQLIASNAIVTDPQLPNLNSIISLFYSPGYAANPCYLSGVSPSIFLYSENEAIFKIVPSYALFTEPSLLENSWIVKANKEGVPEVNNKQVNFLYYEFNPTKVTFSSQDTGFVIHRSELSKLVSSLSKKMNLNKKETDRLVFEFNLALTDVDSTKRYIKVSLVPTQELERKLPLYVTSKPKHTNRYHFVLEGVSTPQKLEQPIIKKVERGSSTLVEIGASGK